MLKVLFEFESRGSKALILERTRKDITKLEPFCLMMMITTKIYFFSLTDSSCIGMYYFNKDLRDLGTYY